MFGPVSAPRYVESFPQCFFVTFFSGTCYASPLKRQWRSSTLDLAFPCFTPRCCRRAAVVARPFVSYATGGCRGKRIWLNERSCIKRLRLLHAGMHVALFARVLLPVIAFTGVGAGLGRLQCTRRGSGRARAGLRAHRLSPSSSRLMLCANRSSATTSKKWRPRFGLLQRAVHVDVGV